MELTTKQRLTRLEALVDILLDERKILHERLAAVGTTSMIEKRNDNLIQGWQYHPDGDFGKPVAPSGNPTETDDSDKHLSESDEYVDLGLPSGIKWAKCNIGANCEEEYGSYYTFDEAIELFKSRVDRAPSKEELNELIVNTEHNITEVNGVKGMRYTSKINGNSIFIPFYSLTFEGSVLVVEGYAYVWSSSIYDSNYACVLRCDGNGDAGVYFDIRSCDYFVRPVKD